jgi:hypothetical protein
MSEAHKAFRDAIAQINSQLDSAVDAARSAGLSDKYIRDALRRRLLKRLEELWRRFREEQEQRRWQWINEEVLRSKSQHNSPEESERRRQESEQQRQQRNEQWRQRNERLQEDHRKRIDEREADAALGLEVINAGYKLLATKHHPDKGGSNAAMARLNRERARLKASV